MRVETYRHYMTTPHDILKKHGKFMESKSLLEEMTKFLQKARNLKKVSAERIAYKFIKKEAEKGPIRKVVFPDRSVIYGLREWPLDTHSIRKKLTEAKEDYSKEDLIKFLVQLLNEETQKSKKGGFWGWLESRRLNDIRKRNELLAEARANAEYMHRKFGLDAMKDLFEIEREKRKELGLE